MKLIVTCSKFDCCHCIKDGECNSKSIHITKNGICDMYKKKRSSLGVGFSQGYDGK